ncbi:arsenate reductase [Polaribacter sp. Hel1_33_49]|jgi:arsenate reductase|uniref:arsenate reductase n=1 Tax=Polaribacter sp. Hel1_33_49 TaxID=1336803 RepID=UPI00052DC7A2|nr:arsenate reductase [Polaribacter sp. Hel1_33_49]KGL61192.1 arsenate reductase [Polaribacter sp. Hel1_33_49]
MLKTSTISLENFFENAFKKTKLTNDRQILLSKIAEAIAKEYSVNEVVNLNFICTHNSRRSQLGQVWSYFAANYFNLNINAFSGGTEVTAFYRNTVKTLQKVGFEFNLTDFSHQNPTYEISFHKRKKSILGFSKLYSNPINIEPFMAITTCNNADKNCPFIPTASHRFHLPFVDPKHSDGTKKQEETYLETSEQIAGEVYFIFATVKKLLS